LLLAEARDLVPRLGLDVAEVGRIERASIDRPRCSRRPLAEIRRVLTPLVLEAKGSRVLLQELSWHTTRDIHDAGLPGWLDAERCHGVERPPRFHVVKRGQDQIGERIPERQRERHAAKRSTSPHRDRRGPAV